MYAIVKIPSGEIVRRHPALPTRMEVFVQGEAIRLRSGAVAPGDEATYEGTTYRLVNLEQVNFAAPGIYYREASRDSDFDGDVTVTETIQWEEWTEEEIRQAQAAAANEEGLATATQAVIAIMAKQLVLDEDLTDEERAALIGIYPVWVVGETIEVGNYRRYDGALYQAVQAHTTQAGWEPPTVPALWNAVFAPDVVGPWVQPTGAHDAYNIGDLVSHNGQVWRSTIDGNVWEPGVTGWEVVP